MAVPFTSRENRFRLSSILCKTQTLHEGKNNTIDPFGHCFYHPGHLFAVEIWLIMSVGIKVDIMLDFGGEDDFADIDFTKSLSPHESTLLRTSRSSLQWTEFLVARTSLNNCPLQHNVFESRIKHHSFLRSECLHMGNTKQQISFEDEEIDLTSFYPLESNSLQKS
jgi:hypothetical protein